MVTESNGESAAAEQAETLPTHQRLDPVRLQPAEHIFRIWHVTVPVDTPLERLLVPEFWSKCTQKFASPAIDQPPDWIICRPPDRSWFAWLLVVSVGPEGVEMVRLAATPLPHRRGELGSKQGPIGTNVDDFEFQDLGVGEGWAIVRRHDHQVMHKCQLQSQCAPWLSQYLRSVRV